MTPQIKQTSLFEAMAEITKPLPNSYFNTLPIAGKELKEAEEITGRQDREVLEYFQKVVQYSEHGNANSWEVVMKIQFYPSIFTLPMSHASVKRALSNLKEAGLLIRTNIRRKGEFKSASCYQLKHGKK